MTMTQSATHNEIWSRVQRGLIYPSPFAVFAIFTRRGGGLTKSVLRDLLAELRKEIHEHMGDAHTWRCSPRTRRSTSGGWWLRSSPALKRGAMF